MVFVCTIVFVIAYVVHTIFIHKYAYIFRILSMGMIILIGMYSVLWKTDDSASFLLLGIFGGQLLFYLSLCLSKLSFKRSIPQILIVRSIVQYFQNNKKRALSKLVTPFEEELLWRCSIQCLFGNTIPGISITAVCFFLIHLDWRKDMFYFLQYLDLLLFSFVLGFLYYYFNNFYLVFTAHYIRNLNIDILRYAQERR
jgi:membrane protease YdiL (CAAX protease family)